MKEATMQNNKYPVSVNEKWKVRRTGSSRHLVAQCPKQIGRLKNSHSRIGIMVRDYRHESRVSESSPHEIISEKENLPLLDAIIPKCPCRDLYF